MWVGCGGGGGTKKGLELVPSGCVVDVVVDVVDDVVVVDVVDAESTTVSFLEGPRRSSGLWTSFVFVSYVVLFLFPSLSRFEDFVMSHRNCGREWREREREGKERRVLIFERGVMIMGFDVGNCGNYLMELAKI